MKHSAKIAVMYQKYEILKVFSNIILYNSPELYNFVPFDNSVNASIHFSSFDNVVFDIVVAKN